MKKYLVLLLTLFALSSCEQDDTIIEATAGKKLPKVDVCHYDAETDTWNTINISMNALEAHRKHGDKYDWDGDGYYPENECGIGEDAGYDCDDTNADYHEEIRRFKDNDGDGYGDKTTRLKSCVPDPNYVWVLNGNDCDDTDPNIHRYTLYGTYIIYRANGAVLNITIQADGTITGEGHTSNGPTDPQTYTGALTVNTDQTILMTILQRSPNTGISTATHYIGGFINECGEIEEDLSDQRTDGWNKYDYSFTDFD